MGTQTEGNGCAQLKGLPFWRAFALVSLFVAAAMAVGVIQRAPWFGELPSCMWQGLDVGRHMAAFSAAVNNWLDEGALAHGFAVVIFPASIENPDYAARGVYVSYPPGHLVPLFLIAKTLGLRVDVPLFMICSFGFQFLTAFFLSLTALYFVRRTTASLLPACLLSATPAIVYLLMPVPMWWYMDLYGPELGVLLPFILVVGVELLRDSVPEDSRLYGGLGWIQSILVLWGILTEWLFVFVVVTLCVKRLASSRDGKRMAARVVGCVPLIVPMVLGLGLFLIQVVYLGKVTQLLLSGKRWGGPMALYTSFLDGIEDVAWNHVIENGGYLAPFLLAATAVAALIGIISTASAPRDDRRARIRRLSTAILLLLVPCLFRTSVLFEHERQHGFDGLKYFMVIALSVPVLVPLLMLDVLQERPLANRLRRHINALFVLIFVAASLYVLSLQGWLANLPPRNPDERVVARFIKENTSYSDIVFSTDVVTPSPPDGIYDPGMRVWGIKELYIPRALVWTAKDFKAYAIELYCNKRIYPALSCHDMLWHMRRGTGQDRDIVGDYNIVLFERHQGELRAYPELTALAALGGPPVRGDDMALYRVPRGAFEDYVRSIHATWEGDGR